jgi:Fe-S-cluster-containing hydrogenase component 2
MQFEHGDLPMVEAERCLGCLLCVPACPHGAIRRGDTQRASPSQ